MPVGDEFRLNDAMTANDQAATALAARPDGGFVVAWQNKTASYGQQIMARLFSASTQAPGTCQGSPTADTLFGSTGADTLMGGAGSDTYLFNRSSGADVVDNRGRGSDGDAVVFGDGIGADQLWFQQTANDLLVSIIGEPSSTLILGWFHGSANQVSEFRLSDGNRLLAGQVGNLVSGMAAMTPPASGQLTLSEQQHQQLDPVIAVNWHHS